MPTQQQKEERGARQRGQHRLRTELQLLRLQQRQPVRDERGRDSRQRKDRRQRCLRAAWLPEAHKFIPDGNPWGHIPIPACMHLKTTHKSLGHRTMQGLQALLGIPQKQMG